MAMKVLLLLSALIFTAHAFSRNAIDLGLVSNVYPLSFWDELASMSEEELNPEFRKLLLFIDRTRAGSDHWCCNHGRTEQAKTPVYNNRGEVVAWNRVPCASDQVGCCRGFLEVANHCLDKAGQTNLLDALDIARNRLGGKDTADLIGLLKEGGLVG